MTSMVQQETLIRLYVLYSGSPPNTPGAREAGDDIQQQTTHRRTILKDWENKCMVATKQHRGVHKDALHQPQNTNSLRDVRDNTTHMVLEGELGIKLHKNDEVVTSANGNPRQDQVTTGGFTVLDLLTTKALVLLGFSILHQ